MNKKQVIEAIKEERKERWEKITDIIFVILCILVILSLIFGAFYATYTSGFNNGKQDERNIIFDYVATLGCGEEIDFIHEDGTKTYLKTGECLKLFANPEWATWGTYDLYNNITFISDIGNSTHKEVKE